jgi:hypothetical protein
MANGNLLVPGALAAWVREWLPFLPETGVLLQLRGDVVWYMAVPDAEPWFGEICGQAGVSNVVRRSKST